MSDDQRRWQEEYQNRRWVVYWQLPNRSHGYIHTDGWVNHVLRFSTRAEARDYIKTYAAEWKRERPGIRLTVAYSVPELNRKGRLNA